MGGTQELLVHKSQQDKCWKVLDQDLVLLFTNDSRWFLALLSGLCLPSLSFMRNSTGIQLSTFLNRFPAYRTLGSPKTFFILDCLSSCQSKMKVFLEI